MRAQLMIKLNKILEAATLYRDRLTEEPDDWAAYPYIYQKRCFLSQDSYTGYLDCIFSKKLEASDFSVPSSRDFIKNFQQSTPNSKRIRGPFLGEIELEARSQKVR